MRTEEFEKSLVELQYDTAKRVGFLCSCCSNKRESDQIGRIGVYHPGPGEPLPFVTKTGPKSGTFIVCTECVGLPKEKVRLAVVKSLARHKLFEE